MELHTSAWYAAKVISHLPKEAFKPVPTRLWGGLALLLLVTVPVTLIARNDLPLVASLALSVLIGTGLGGLGFLGHEILHGSVVKIAWLRDLLGGIAFAQFLLGPKLWRKWHNVEHHAHTQEEHTDPDAMGTMEQFFRRPALRFLYRLPPWVRSLITFIAFLGFFTVFCMLMLKRYYSSFRPRDRVIVLAQLAAPILLWTGLLAVLGPAKWVFAYLVPVMLANFLVISYISTNHQLNPLTELNDPLANSLSVIVPRWMDVLHLNFSHHAEHHLFPGMNPKWAPLVREQLRLQFPDRYHEMPFGQALLSLWRTPRIYMNHTELVDPHRGLAFGSLGHGLDPNSIHPRSVNHEA